MAQTFAAYSVEAGRVEGYLAGLKDVAARYPGTPEAFQAATAAARTRTDFLVMAAGSGAPELVKRLLIADGKLAEGKEPTNEQSANYFKSLAAECQTLSKQAQDGNAAKALNDSAGLLFYLAQAQQEAAGDAKGNELIVPDAWLKPVTDGKAATDGDAAKATTDKTEPAVGAPEKNPAIVLGGADAGTLLALAAADSPVALRARYLVVAALLGGIAQGKSTGNVARWLEVADGAGKVLCAACGQLATVKEQFIDEVLFLKENAGIVCPEAAAAAAAGTPVAEAIATKCLAQFGLTGPDGALTTPLNTLVFRFLALSQAMLTPPPAGLETDPFLAELKGSALELATALGNLQAVFPAIKTFPKEKWEEMKDGLVLYSEMSEASPAFDYMPLETVIVDEKGVSEAARPLAQAVEKGLKFLDKEAGLAFPGKLIIDVAGIAKEIEAKHAKLKEQKVTFDEKLGAYLVEVTIRGTKFMKPDFSIPSVVEAASKLTDKIGQYESQAYPYLAKGTLLNHKRPEWPEFKDTVGKAGLFAVDLETPALLFKRVLDSLYYADYKDDRILKGNGILGTVPTVFFTEKFVDASVLDTTYKRPILVYVTEGGQVRFYPPTNRTRKGRMTASRHPRKKDTEWPGKYRNRVDPRVPDPLWNLFMAYTKVDSKNFDEDVVGIAEAMKKKWDNGNVFYVVADDNAKSGWVVRTADLLARLPSDPPMEALDKAYPGYSCDAALAPEQCTNQIVVLFPDVEIPYLPGKKKVKEVGTSVYCDEKDIAAKIKAKRGAIKFCYDPELQKNPKLQGKVVFNFTIGSTGKITQMSVAKDGLGNKNVLKCTMGVIKRINFRRPIGGECVIRYPYVFKP